MKNLWRFNGGVKLPGNKHLSIKTQLVDASLPKQLIFPLQQRSGISAKPTVKPGERVLRGQILSDDESLLGVPIHASSSGLVSHIEERTIPHPSGLAGSCIVIATDGLDEQLPQQKIPDFYLLQASEIINIIKQAGIVGLGGAAFPAAVKLSSGQQRQIDTLIINGAECEPYITCDDRLLQDNPEQVITGALILLHALAIEHCIIAVEADMSEAQAALLQTIQEVAVTNIKVTTVPTLYPTGGEKQLIRVLTGRETPGSGIPADIGIVCQNVGTAAAIFQAVVQGKPLTERIITLTGSGVIEPKNMKVRIGTPIADLIEQCGGYHSDVNRLIMGGPMMGFALPNDALPVLKSTNCILATTGNETHLEKKAMPCIRCGECANVCPINLLPQQLYWYSRADNLKQSNNHHLFDCIECGCCDVVCPSHIPLVQYFRATKSKVILKNQEAEKAAHAKLRHTNKLLRQENAKQQRKERALKKKQALAKIKATMTTNPDRDNNSLM